MPTTELDFEQPITELERQIRELRASPQAAELEREIASLELRLRELIANTYAQLDPWQISQVARHPQRPHALDLIGLIFTDFQELAGDRSFADDPAIVGGLARLDGHAVMVIGQQKGRDTKQKVRRNFGMPRPEGYRKALRLMRLAEQFRLPLITLIDTPGAYPGVGAEERNQSEAIARNLLEMSQLGIPILSCVIGEGGSGGALAIGVADRMLMLEYAIYSVISPEGCASILWKNADHARDAAEALGLTSARLLALGLVDRVVPEPVGGAHRDHAGCAARLKQDLLEELERLRAIDPERLVAERYRRLRQYGQYESA